MADRESPSPPPPTFAGRLQVSDFLYRGDTDDTAKQRPAVAPPRLLRSGRVVSAAKRKAAEEDEEEDDEGPVRRGLASRTSSFSVSPAKRPRGRAKGKATGKSSGYAPPATYAHLPLLPDAMAPHLLVLFIGLNPGIETARSGHAYAHPSNLFWKLLAKTGVTPVACRPQEDRTLPARFRLGLTNIVARPSRSGSELRADELDAGVAVLAAKARRWRPASVCIVGKSIWESVVRVRYGRGKKKNEHGRPPFHYGWQSESENLGRLGRDGLPASAAEADADVADGVTADPDWPGARVFVASSTSGLAASLRPAEKEAIWQELGDWVQERRQALEAETGQTWT